MRLQFFSSLGWLDALTKEKLDSIEVVLGDIRDYHSVASSMQSCDSVLHLAALIAIPYSYQAPQSYIDTNISGTLNILNAARELNISELFIPLLLRHMDLHNMSQLTNLTLLLANLLCSLKNWCRSDGTKLSQKLRLACFYH